MKKVQICKESWILGKSFNPARRLIIVSSFVGNPGFILYIYIYTYRVTNIYIYTLLVFLSVCLFFCPFVSIKPQNGWTDKAKIVCGTLHDPREGLWNIKIGRKIHGKLLEFFWIWKEKSAQIWKWFKMANFQSNRLFLKLI